MATLSNRALALAGVLAVAMGFGGGFLSAQLAQSRSDAQAEAAAADQFRSPFFGWIRGERADRAGPAKPREFAVWRSTRTAPTATSSR